MTGPTPEQGSSLQNISFVSDETDSTILRSPSGSISQTLSTPEFGVDSIAEVDIGASAAEEKKEKPDRKKARLFFAALCTIFLFQFAFVSGYTPSILSALEMRYGLKSIQVGTVVATYDASGLLAAIPISYIGGSAASRIGHRPIWIGVSGLVMAVGSFIWALPHFISGLYMPDDSSIFQLSENGSVPVIAPTKYCSLTESGFYNASSYANSTDSSSPSHISAISFATFIAGHTISGIAALAPISLGPPYLQDGISPSSFPIYLGILYSTTAIGPVLGFGLGALCQTFYVDFPYYLMQTVRGNNDDFYDNLTPASPKWIGAWWLGYVILSILLAVSSIPFFFFPRSLAISNVAEKKKRPTVMEDTTASIKSASSTSSLLEEIDDNDNVLPTLNEAPWELARDAWRLMTNPVWILNNIIFVAVSSPVNGFVIYLKKYMESMFGYSAPTASLLMGGILVPAAAFGVGGGGVINKKCGTGFVRIATRHILYATFACGSLVVMMLVRCPNSAVVGVHIPYFTRHQGHDSLSFSGKAHSIPSSVKLNHKCNTPCSCNPERYEPICGSDGLTYFSGCYAGCLQPHKKKEKGLTFSECTCINNWTSPDDISGSVVHSHYDYGTAEVGACTHCLASAAIFLSVTFIATLTLTFGHNGTMLMLLRSIPRSKRALSLGLHNVLFKLLSAVPAPLLFGNAVDSACIFVSSTGGETFGSSGSYCLLYNAGKLALAIFGLAFCYCGIGVFFLLILFSYLTRKRWLPFVKRCCPLFQTSSKS